jgi:hypothetical protein
MAAAPTTPRESSTVWCLRCEQCRIEIELSDLELGTRIPWPCRCGGASFLIRPKALRPGADPAAVIRPQVHGAH